MNLSGSYELRALHYITTQFLRVFSHPVTLIFRPHIPKACLQAFVQICPQLVSSPSSAILLSLSLKIRPYTLFLMKHEILSYSLKKGYWEFTNIKIVVRLTFSLCFPNSYQLNVNWKSRCFVLSHRLIYPYYHSVKTVICYSLSRPHHFRLLSIHCIF